MRELISDSLTDPAKAARALLKYRVSVAHLFQINILLGCLTAIIGMGIFLTSPEALKPLFVQFYTIPILQAATQVMSSFVLALLISRGGQMLGGVAEFDKSLLIVTWISFMQMMLLGVLLIATNLMMMLVFIVSVSSMVWYFWAMTQFVKEAHGFDRAMPAFGTFVMAILASLIVTSLVLNLSGLTMQEIPSDL